MRAFAEPTRVRESSLSLEEALRTVALALDASRTERVRITIDATGMTLDAPATLGLRTYTWDTLAHESRRQHDHCAREERVAPWINSWTLTRWSVLLRLTGRLLDVRDVRACRISAAVATRAEPHNCELRVQVDEDTVFDANVVVAALQRLWAQHGVGRPYRAAGLASPPPSRRRWWARWLPAVAGLA